MKRNLYFIFGFWLVGVGVAFAQVPTIATFSPASGPIGTSVIITGTNFSATAGSNIVYFGATKATVTAASTTQLTVTVPMGASYQSITVTVGGLTAYSSLPFTPTFASAGSVGASSFATRVDFSAGPDAVSLHLADLDGDGKADYINGNFGSGSGTSASVRQNISVAGTITATSLAAGVSFTAGTGPAGNTFGDLDGDGKLDLVVVNQTSNTASVYRNTSVTGSITSGSFTAKVDLATGAGPNDVSIKDLDGDGKPEIVTANITGNSVSILKNISTPGTITASSFAAKVDFTAGTNPWSVAIGDLDNDGKPDLTASNSNSSTVSVFRNTASTGTITSSSFAAKVDFTTGTATSPRFISLSDLDGDLKLDIAVANNALNTVSVFRNTSTSGTITTSSFAAKVDLTTGTGPWGLTTGDIDGDGKPEIVVANNGASSASIFKNVSTSGTITVSSFSAKVDNTTGSAPVSVIIGDIDGDGLPDLSTTGSTFLSVFRNIIATLSGPTITSFSPLLGAVGSSVTIAGTNFSTTPANNIVYFGAAKATVTAASSTQLTVTVPPGTTYQPITVTAAGLTASSAKPFDVTFSGGGTIALTSFAAKVDVTVGAANFNNQISVADLDGDSKPDLAIADQTGTAISVIRNTSTSGSITFSSFVDFTTGAIPQGVTIADLDGDGKLDLASINNSGNTLSTFRNVSSSGNINSSSFSAKTDFTTGTGPLFGAVGDIDSDGKPDVAVTNATANSVSIFKNTSAGGIINFAAKSDLTTGTSPRGVALGDIDGDGKLDLAVANYSSTSFSVFRNTSTAGTIGFAAKIDVTVASTSPLSLALGDLDGDGKLDVVVTNDAGVSVSVFRNTSTVGSISFASKIDLTAGTRPYSVTISDLDGDGKPDLAVASNSVNTASLFKNTSVSGTISFNTKIDFTTGTNPTSIAVADFDGDGKPDLAALNSLSPTVSLFRNTMSAGSAPTITSFSPASGAVGTVVTITGTNFSATPANNTVKFNGTVATVTVSTATSITTTVPAGATTGTVTVTVGSSTGTSSSGFTVSTATAQGVIVKAVGVIGGTLNDYIQSTTVDASGNVYIAGGFSGTVNFNPNGTASNHTSLGGFDAFFAKYTSTGALAWANQIGSTGDDQVYSITVDATGNVYVTGYFNGTVDFDPGAGVSNLTSAGAADIFYGKYSAAGALTWAAIHGSTGADAGNAIKVDGSGNVYVTGFFNGTVDFDPGTGTNNQVAVGSDDIFLIKVAGTGSLPTLSWAESFGSTLSDTGYGIDLDNANVYLSGYYSGTINFGPGTSTSSATNLGGKDAYFAKYAASTGLLQWWATIRSTADDYATSVVVNGTNFYLAGAVSGSASFYSLSGNVTKNSNGGTDIFVAKYDGTTSTPTLMWANTIGGTLDDGSNLLAVDAAGNAYTTGFFQGTVNFDPNGTANLVSAGGEDAYLASYTSASGSLRISNRIGGTSDDEGTTIAVDAFNSIYVGGTFQGTASFDFTSSAQDKTAAGLSDAFLAVYGQISTTSSIQITGSSLPTTYDYGGSLTASITVNDHALVSSMQFSSLGISQSYTVSSVQSQVLTASGNTYQVTLPTSSLTDPIGLIYYFQIIDIANDTTTVPITTQQFGAEAFLHYPSTATAQAIPSLTFGDQPANYQIVAVPLTLTKPNVTDVFSALGSYDNTKWRLFDYTNGDNREYPGFSTIIPGKGYWLIARNSVSINPGEGSTLPVDHQNPFTITLKPGWNLIGNPFNFRISWNDIVTANGSDPSISDNRNWKLFSGGALTKSDVLDKYRGAFVFNSGTTDFTLDIPALRNTTLGGRQSGHQDVINSIDQQHWEVPLTLSNGELSNELGGIGMDPQATLTGKDQFDEVSVPVPEGLGLFELAYPHPELHAIFNKEVVPTQENFTWNFDVKRPGEQNNIELTWNNDYFGNNSKRLMLFDPATLQLTDMRITDHYKLNAASKRVRFLFGTSEYIVHELDNELPWLGSPYPNPAIGMLTIPFRVPETKNQMPVMISIYDSKGTMVASPVNQTLNSGNYDVKWGSPNGESGMYLIRMSIGSETTKTVKVVLN